MKTNLSVWLGCFTAALAMGACELSLQVHVAMAQDVMPAGRAAEKRGDSGAGQAAKSSKPRTTKKERLALVGADIITVTRETVRGGTILIEDGKIKALGQNLELPEGTTRIDAVGKVITPGFVAIKMSGVGLRGLGRDRGAKIVDGLDPFDRNISLSLGVGITSGCIQIRGSGGGRFSRAPEDGFPVTERFPGLDPDAEQLTQAQPQVERDYGEYVSVCPCCGLPILPTEPITSPRPTPITPQKNAVIKMSFGRLEGMLVSESAFLDVTPGSLSGALNQHTWREQLAKARQYLKDQAKHEQATAAGKKEKPPRKPVSDEILRLVKKEISLRIASSSVAAMRDMIQLAAELDYRLVIDGAAEAWVIADELAEANVPVIITPRSRRSPRFGEEETSGTWIETSRVLESTGVPFAVSSLGSSISLGGLAGRDLTSLPLEAAFAVRGGASERAALAAITIVPAKMLGLEDRIGSIEVGKDADLLLLDGSPLDYRSYVETALVNGRIAYRRAKDRVLPVFDR